MPGCLAASRFNTRTVTVCLPQHNGPFPWCYMHSVDNGRVNLLHDFLGHDNRRLTCPPWVDYLGVAKIVFILLNSGLLFIFLNAMWPSQHLCWPLNVKMHCLGLATFTQYLKCWFLIFALTAAPKSDSPSCMLSFPWSLTCPHSCELYDAYCRNALFWQNGWVLISSICNNLKQQR